MTPDDARFQTIQLVSLGELDVRRGEAQLLIDSVPRVLGSRQRGSKDAEAQVETAKLKLRGFQAHLKTLELDLASREQLLGKANGNLLTAKSNQEYSLLMSEIARRKDDRGAIEERILEQYEVIKQGERLVKEAEVRLAEAREEFSAFEQRAHGELREHQKELAALDERREVVRRAIDGEVLKLYDRAYKAHGRAIAIAEGKTCQGCFSILTPNDSNRLMSCRQLVVCRVCQRILYMPELLQASPS